MSYLKVPVPLSARLFTTAPETPCIYGVQWSMATKHQTVDPRSDLWWNYVVECSVWYVSLYLVWSWRTTEMPHAAVPGSASCPRNVFEVLLGPILISVVINALTRGNLSRKDVSLAWVGLCRLVHGSLVAYIMRPHDTRSHALPPKTSVFYPSHHKKQLKFSSMQGKAC